MYAKNFDLGLSVESGQPLTFHGNYRKHRNRELLSYVTAKGLVEVECIKRNGLARIGWNASGYSEAEAKREIVTRLGLDDDMQRIYSHIGTDRFMAASVKELDGMRITRNDPWETTLCFIISQFNNIKRIRLITQNLINEFGEQADYGNGKIHLFPAPDSIACSSLTSIRKCGTGFRDRYIKSVAEACTGNMRLDGLAKKGYDAAKRELMELDGIGDKVADCILLYGYKKLDAFPIDTWVKRVVEHVYFKGRKKSIRRIHEFAQKRWPEYRGYAQHYLFWSGRLNKIGR